MGARKIEDLEGASGDGAEPRATVSAAPVRDPATVELNYPDPTLLSVVVREVSRWSGLAFVMEPSCNAKIQIFSARKLTPEQAYDLFLISLTVVGLRAIQSGRIVKIVPVQYVVSA